MASNLRVLELSDVISVHSYLPLERMAVLLDELKQYGRPILMTEWLNRMENSGVRELYPLFYLERIGCWCWGMVVGKTQTHEPWNYLWNESYLQAHEVDFTKWLHDLFRPNLRPYDPREIEIIQRYNAQANQKYGNIQGK